ncbi:MAG: histidine kinase [Draconibacterium sp.]
MPQKFQVLIFLIFASSGSYSQPNYEQFEPARFLNSKLYIEKGDSLNIETVSSPGFFQNFKPIDKPFIASPSETYWYFIDLSEINLSDTIQHYIRFSYYDKITFYYRGTGSLSIRNAGLRNKVDPEIVDFSDIPFSNTELVRGKYLFAKVRDYTGRNRIRDLILVNNSSLLFFEAYQHRNSQRREIPYFLFIGGMTLIISFFIGYYFLYRDKLFIVYSLYLISLLLYLGSKAEFAQEFLREYCRSYIYFYNNIIQVVVNIFSLVFAVAFLNARKAYPKLYVFIKYTTCFLLFVVVLLAAIYIINPFSGFEETILNIERYYMIVFSLLAYVYILMNLKNRLAVFFVAGSFSFLSGAVLALFLRNVEYMMYGAAAEVFIFSLGMGYRMKQVEAEKNRIEGEIDRVRLTALRAQMNPHFIFNSLNSIRAYVISNKVKEASRYLSKFSQLIRLILR